MTRARIAAALLLAGGLAALVLAGEGEELFLAWGHRVGAVTTAGGEAADDTGRTLLAAVGETSEGGEARSTNYRVAAGFLHAQGHDLGPWAGSGPLVWLVDRPASRVFGVGGEGRLEYRVGEDVDYEIARVKPDGTPLETLEAGSREPGATAGDFLLLSDDLEEGENRVVVRATAADGSRKEGVELRVRRDTEPPQVGLAGPPATLGFAGYLETTEIADGARLLGSLDGGAPFEIPVQPRENPADTTAEFAASVPVGFRTLDLTVDLRSGRRACLRIGPGAEPNPALPEIPPLPDSILRLRNSEALSHELGLRFGDVDARGKFGGTGLFWVDEDVRRRVAETDGLDPAALPNGFELEIKGKLSKYKKGSRKIKLTLVRKQEPKTKVKISASLHTSGDWIRWQVNTRKVSVKVGNYPGGRTVVIKSKDWGGWGPHPLGFDLSAATTLSVDTYFPRIPIRAVDREGAVITVANNTTPSSGNHRRYGTGVSPFDFETPLGHYPYPGVVYVSDDADPPNWVRAPVEWSDFFTNVWRWPWE